MDVTKALHISQEIHPYVPATTMSVLCRDVAQWLQTNGVEVRTFMPKYGCINERRNQLHEVIRLSGLNIPIDDNDHPLIIKVAMLQPSRLQVYCIDNDDFFHHHASTALEIENLPEDNDERSIFFSVGVIETVRKLRWYPEIVHCEGWITALCPALIKTKYPDDPAFKNAKVVFSVFGGGFEGELDPRMAEKVEALDIPADALKAITEGPVDFNTLNRLAIDNSDAVVAATADANPELLEYARAQGKPVLDFPGLDNPQAYADFYATL